LFYFLALRCLALVRFPGADDSCSLSVLAATGGMLERAVVLAEALGLPQALEVLSSMICHAEAQ
jgi:hypothetical protein